MLNNVICRALGDRSPDLSRLIQYRCTDGDEKLATVTVMWPTKFEATGFASRKVDAERFAAAAACHRLKEMGVIGPDNELLRRAQLSLFGADEDHWIDHVHVSGGQAQSESQDHEKLYREREVEREVDPRLPEALGLFPKPKLLLAKVVQVANSSNRFKDLVQYRATKGGREKVCQLTLRWPEEMTFVASAGRRAEAERRAAALACLRLKEMNLLGDNNDALTHAQYHQDEMRESREKNRRPYPMEIPEHLKEKLREYITEYPSSVEMNKLWEEEEHRAQQRLNRQDEDEEEERLTDAITGRRYRPLDAVEAEQLSAHLQEEWDRADPGLGLKLPVDEHRQRVLTAVASSRAVVIAGETGCGKTTRIPRFLLEGSVRSGDGASCNILVTQPRRISAVSVAHRVAQEMGPALKRSVGYQVRLESRPPEESGGALLFLTVGVLLRKLQSNTNLTGISHVVVDEVHERDVNTDLLLALLRSALQKNPHLRVVLMSATGDNQRLARYFGDCPVVKVPGFMHPVQDLYLEEVLREMKRPPPPPARVYPEGQTPRNDAAPDLDLVADVIEHIHQYREPGAVLCFLPGWQDIKAVQEKLENKVVFRRGDSHRIIPLHSSMSVADQQVVFQRPPEGQRKIVLATNIAETAITIDDIVHVVDVGTQKEQYYDPKTKVSSLDTNWISRSNVTQRRGRAGRCQPGHAYHLFPRSRLESMTPFPIPEILRTPLESLVLQAKIHNPHIKTVDFLSQVLDSPERHATMDAVAKLQNIGVLDRQEALTPLGERVACMSCDPQLGKVLVLAATFRCVLPVLSVAACLTRDPFYNSMQNRAQVNKAKDVLSGSSCSDYIALSRAVAGYRRVQAEGSMEERHDFMNEYMLSRASLRFINGLISQFSENLCDARLVPRSLECQQPSSLYNQQSRQEELVKAVLLAGLYPNLIQRNSGTVVRGRFKPKGVSYRTMTGPVQIHRSSVNRGNQKLPSRWLTFFSAVKSSDVVFIRDSSSVHPLSLLLFTDCDLREKVYGNRVEVSIPGFRCELSAQTWELLLEVRTSMQAMLHRHLLGTQQHDNPQDRRLISLLVQLLNNTVSDSQPCDSNHIDYMEQD